MCSTNPLKFQISSWTDKAKSLFLAFLGNTDCIYRFLKDDIFRHCLRCSPETALCCQHIYLTGPWERACGCLFSINAVAEQGHPSLLIYRAGHTLTSLTGALPGGGTCYTKSAWEMWDLEQLYMCLQPNQSFPHPTAINEILFQQASWQYETLHARVHTVLWLSEVILPNTG